MSLTNPKSLTNPIVHYFIAYDITEDKLRRRVALLLQRQAAARVQKSVWLLKDLSPKQIKGIQQQLDKILLRYTDLRTPSDSIICIPIQHDRIPDLVWVGEEAQWKNILEKLLFVWL